MVPLLVVLTILGFVGVDWLVQAVEKRKKTVKVFSPATDLMWHGGLPSMADGGEPIKTEDEAKDK